MEPRTNLIQKLVLLCVPVEVLQTLEMSLIYRPIVHQSELDFGLDARRPLVEHTFHLVTAICEHCTKWGGSEQANTPVNTRARVTTWNGLKYS
jgi:hypothetical protein